MDIVKKALKRETLEKREGYDKSLLGKIQSLPLEKYRIIKGLSVGGDAPKELLLVYEYKKGAIRAGKPKNWPIYIAKTGQKWYPFESVTEYMLNRLGVMLGLKMAESKLYFINGQLRFLSKLFRDDKYQILEHGAELYSGNLEDRDFVEEVELKNKAREFFTVSFTKDVLQNQYPMHAEDIFLDFVNMLVFDAIVGNNDRHFYNWAILKHIKSKHKPHFSPIYDTARAFFWNSPEQFFIDLYNDKNRLPIALDKYIKNSKPKIGIEKNSNCNHIDMVRLLNSNKFNGTKDVVNSLINEENKFKCIELLENEFSDIFSKERFYVIRNCLILRFDILLKEIQ